MQKRGKNGERIKNGDCKNTDDSKRKSRTAKTGRAASYEYE